MDEIDVAQQNNEFFQQLALRAHYARRQDTLRRAKSSEAGLASGGSGTLYQHKTCCDCGEKIGMARLKALPNAVRCISCQEEKERRDRNLG